MDNTRISLRPFNISDANDLFTWANDENVTYYLRWNTITSIEAATNYIQQVVIPHPWRRSICLNNHSIGYVSVRPEPRSDQNHRAHIGYAIGSDYWGQGIVTKALKMAIPIVFNDFPNLLRLEALVEPANIGSQKVGFKKEGFLRKYCFNKGEIRDMFIYT